MTIKRPTLLQTDPGPMQADGHLTDAALLLAIDGELSAAERALVKNHVRACWRCRARREHFERTIEEIVQYEHRLVVPDMPPSVGGRAIFMARLDQLGEELGVPLPHWRQPMRLLQASGAVFSSRIMRIAATVLVLAGGVYLVLQRDTPVVSASELLQRAAAVESSSLTGINQPIVIQKLSIDINGHKFARTIYRDVTYKRLVQHADLSASEELAAERDFGRSSFSWDDPLSPQTYSQWRASVSQKQESVAQLNGGQLKLDTKASEGPVAEASLTFRSGDYHPIAEELRLRDNNRIEVAELSYEVVALSSLGSDIFGKAVAVEAPRSAVVHIAPPSPVQLEASELQVYSVLHHVAADLGEQITVHHATDGQIVVEGITENDARSQQITTALAGIPFSSSRIESVAEATAHLEPNTPHIAHATLVSSNPPLLEEQLKRIFPELNHRTTYVTASMYLCQDASAHAWALNRLADRYTPQDVALLGPDDQTMLRGILNDHITALQKDVDRLQRQLGQVLDDDQDTVSTSAESGEQTQASAPSPQLQSDDWRLHAHRVHEAIEVANDAVASLLVGATGTEPSLPNQRLRLHTALTRLQKERELLDKQLSASTKD